MDKINPDKYIVTDEIHFGSLSHILIKVKDHLNKNGGGSNEEFCYVYTFDEALQLMSSLATTLISELSQENDVKSGWVQILRDENERGVVISKRQLGRIYNGTKIPVYTLSAVEVNRGICIPPKIDTILEDLKEKLDPI